MGAQGSNTSTHTRSTSTSNGDDERRKQEKTAADALKEAAAYARAAAEIARLRTTGLQWLARQLECFHAEMLSRDLNLVMNQRVSCCCILGLAVGLLGRFVRQISCA